MPAISGDILGPGILFGLAALLLSSLLVFIYPHKFDGPGNTSAGLVLFLTYSLSSVIGISSRAIDQPNLLFSTALANLVLSVTAISALSRFSHKLGKGGAVQKGERPRNVVRLEMTLVGLAVVGSAYAQIYESGRIGASTEGSLNGVLVVLQALLGGCITSPYMLGTRGETYFSSSIPLTTFNRGTSHAIHNNSHSTSTITTTSFAANPSSTKAKQLKRVQLRRRMFTIPIAIITASASTAILLFAKIKLKHDVQPDGEAWSVGQMFFASSGFIGLYSTIIQGLYATSTDDEDDEDEGEGPKNHDEDGIHEPVQDDTA